MNEKTQKTLDLIINNQKILKKRMFWELASNETAIMGALIQAAKEVEADKERYVQCKKILKKNIDMFSAFRGIASTMIISKMTVEDNPEEYLKGCLVVYKKLRSIHKLIASPYMVMAAMTLYESGGIDGSDELIEKLEDLYKTLKKQHPFLITDDDRGYLAMLVASGLNLDVMCESIENSYQACKGVSFDKNRVNSLAQVLALSSKDPGENAEEVAKLLRLFKEKKHPISKYYGLGAVGALVLLNKSAEEKAELVTEIADYIKRFSPFKWYHMGKRRRMVYACLMAVMTNSEGISENVAGNISNTLTMTIVEEIIMTLIIIMITSSSSSSSGSSAGSGS